MLNGAAMFHHKSLNSSLLVAPDLLRNLFSVLIRFREHPYAASADIEGMFLQVGVPPADQRSRRFLWQEDPLSKVVVHQYKRRDLWREGLAQLRKLRSTTNGTR